MKDCIFCKIANKDVESHVVYEDAIFLGFLDIYPVSKGHTLLIPKIHTRWVHDVEPFGQYWESARKIKLMLDASFNPKWVQYFTHGAIDHAHIHVIPRYESVEEGVDLLPTPTSPASQEDLKAIREQIIGVK